MTPLFLGNGAQGYVIMKRASSQPFPRRIVGLGHTLIRKLLFPRQSGRSLFEICPSKKHIYWPAILFLPVVLFFLSVIISQAKADSSVALTAEERIWLNQNPEKLTLLFNTEFPPIEFVSESGSFVGMGADVIAKVEEKLDVTFIKYPSDDWNRHLASLKSGECAIAPTIVSTAERERYAFFTTPYATVPVVIITDRSFPKNLTLNDLEGHRVGVVSGYATEKYVRNLSLEDFELVLVQNVAEGLRSVSFGQLDAFVENLPVAAYYIAKEGIPNLRVAGKTAYAFSWRIGVSRKYPLLYSSIQKAMDTIPESEFENIRKRWVALDTNIGMDPESVRRLRLAAWFVALLVLSLTGITLFLKHRLNENVAGLLESERKYRELVENANSIIIRMDARCHVTFFNEFAQQFFGFPEKEILGRHVVGTIVPPTDTSGQDLVAMMNGIARNPEAYANNENENMRCNGERIWIAWTNKPIFDNKGHLREILCVGNDITDRKHAEEALRESEDRFKTLSDKSPLGMSLIDADGHYEYVNPAFIDIFGYDLSEIKTGKDWFKLAYPDPKYRRMVIGAWNEDLKRYPQQELRPRTFEVLCKDDSRKTIFFRPVTLNSGKQLILYEDITEQKRAEEVRQKLQAQLIQAQKMESVGRLAGGVAHDFNNMLGVILGHVELALMKMSPNDALLEDLKEIRKAADRSAELTRQLLAFARKQTVVPKILDISETVEGMLKMLRRLIGENINLLWMPGKNIWPVKVDPAQIDQILANLCVNARDAILGAGKITIETCNAVLDHAYCLANEDIIPGDYVILAVGDNGVGMGKDTLDKLFEPFFTTKEVGKGTGLGLAMVYGIVKQNNGFIHVISDPGKGTTFKIHLPRYTGKTIEPAAQGKAKVPQGQGETVLLVEDELSILNMGKIMLERLGYNVLTADTPAEAIRMIEEHNTQVHLLITDVVMPEMNGWDLARQLGLIHPNLRCLFMSGYTADVIARHGLLEENVIFIQKPFSMKDLAVKVHEALNV
jgi:PAS domain S-box-containing protein